MSALHDLLEPGLPATAPALQPVVRAVLQAARDGRLEALTGEEAAAAVVLCTAAEGARLLEAHVARAPVAALEVALRVCRLHLRLALVNGVLARVLERPSRKPSSTLPSPDFWRALRRALEASPGSRPAACALAAAADLTDLRIRAAVAFAVPDAALWTPAHHEGVRQALSFLDPVDASFFLLGLVRHAGWAAAVREWPPPRRALRELPEDVLETTLALVGDHAALARLADARAVAEAASDPAALLAAPLEGGHLTALARVTPDAAAIALAVERLSALELASAAVVRAVLTGWVLAAPDAADEAAARAPAVAATVSALRQEARAHLPATGSLPNPWSMPRAGPSRGAPPAAPPTPAPGRWASAWRPPPSPSNDALVTDVRQRLAADAARRLRADAPREADERLAASGRPGEVPALTPLVEALGPAVLPAAAAWARSDLRLLPALAHIDDGALAPAWVLAFSSRRRPLQEAARVWLEAHPRLAAFGGVALLWTADAAERKAARRALRWLEPRQPAAIVESLRALSPEQQAWVEAARAETSGLPARPPALPSFLALEALPGVATQDERARLAPDSVRTLLSLARASSLDDADALLSATSALDAASLGHLAGAVFTRWLAAGGPPKERWAMQLLAHVPSDDWAAALGALCLRWAQTGFPGRAQDGVEVLARMPSRTALSEVQRLSTRVRTRGLRAKAAEAFEDAALRLGLSRAELEDRLVPDFGLTTGRKLAEDLQVDLDDASRPVLLRRGVRVKAPPKGTSEAACACWAAVKQGASHVKAAALRLERLMCEGHALPAPHFVEVWLMHPLLARVAERVAWAAFTDGPRRTLFLTGPLRAVDGAPFALDEAMSVRPVHPLELSDTEHQALAAQLPTPAFPQLGRAVHHVVDLAEALRERAGATASTAALIALERAGWARGPTLEGGSYVTVARRGPGWRVELEFEPGVSVVDPTAFPDQRLVRAHLEGDAAMTPVARSELVRQLPFST
jgi:hypothetical protein